MRIETAAGAGALREYLDLTRQLQDPQTLRTRSEVQQTLGRLGSG